jgi:hypothetical protein
MEKMLDKKEQYIDIVNEFSKEINSVNYSFIVAIAAFFINAIFWLNVMENEKKGIALIAIFFGLIITRRIYMSKKLEFIKHYKEKLITRIIHDIDDSLEYFPNKGMSQDKFNSMQIFISSDMYKSEDLITFEIDGLEFKISEIYASKSSGSGKNRRTTTIFTGEVFEFKFKKPFKEPLYIVPDIAQNLFGSFGKMLQETLSITAKVVTMDNPAFEQKFKVMSDDEINARYVLTPGFMQKILEFSYKDQYIYVECKGDTMYLFIPNSTDKFEPSLDKQKIIDDIEKNIDHIERILELAKILKLSEHHINVNAI